MRARTKGIFLSDVNRIEDYTPNHLGCYLKSYRSGFNKNKEIVVSDILGDIEGKTVLDFGCGCGIFSNYCHNQGAKVISLDFSPIMLKFVKQTNPTLDTIQGNVANTSFRNDSFDVILALDVIEHLDKPKQFLKEIRRTLKRDGVALLITPNTQVLRVSRFFYRFYSRILQMIFKGLPRRPQYPPGHHKCTHVKVYSVDEMEHFLRQAHFRILAYDTFSNVPLFNIADKLMSMFFRGPLKKHKWNRGYFYVEKKAKPKKTKTKRRKHRKK